MNLDEAHFRQVLSQLCAESPLACRAILGLARLEFTDRVPTLAVTLSTPPVLRVNLGFVRAHAQGEEDVEAMLLHEFLHVLLRHTERLRVMTPLLNVALDAGINATIHRVAGARHSAFFSRHYRDAGGLLRLLRPPDATDVAAPGFMVLWSAVYGGLIPVGELYRLLRDEWVREMGVRLPPGCVFLGNHDDRDSAFGVDAEALPGDVARALRRTRDALAAGLEGQSRWPSSDFESTARPDDRVARWLPLVRRVFAALAVPDPRGRRLPDPDGGALLPVLHPGDRRAVLRALWNPILPPALWPHGSRHSPGTVNLYLDASGSMSCDLPSLLTLLLPLQREIRRPFWAFSGHVARAEFDRGRLRTRSDGATSIRCVLEHFIGSGAPSAVVVTDGHVGRAPETLVRRLRGRAVHALVLPGGPSGDLGDAGIRCTHLP